MKTIDELAVISFYFGGLKDDFYHLSFNFENGQQVIEHEDHDGAWYEERKNRRISREQLQTLKDQLEALDVLNWPSRINNHRAAEVLPRISYHFKQDEDENYDITPTAGSSLEEKILVLHQFCQELTGQDLDSLDYEAVRQQLYPQVQADAYDDIDYLELHCFDFNGVGYMVPISLVDREYGIYTSNGTDKEGRIRRRKIQNFIEQLIELKLLSWPTYTAYEVIDKHRAAKLPRFQYQFEDASHQTLGAMGDWITSNFSNSTKPLKN